MKGLKISAIIVTAIAVLSLAESAKADSDKGNKNDNSGGGGQTQPVTVPEGGSTLLLLGAALAGVGAYRRWVRIPNS